MHPNCREVSFRLFRHELSRKTKMTDNAKIEKLQDKMTKIQIILKQTSVFIISLISIAFVDRKNRADTVVQTNIKNELQNKQLSNQDSVHT